MSKVGFVARNQHHIKATLGAAALGLLNRFNYKSSPAGNPDMPPRKSKTSRKRPQIKRKARRVKRLKFAKGKTSKNGGFYKRSAVVNKFAKPTVSGANYDKKYMQYGASIEYETTGSLTDPNCVYVGHTSAPVDRSGHVVFMGLLRKLFHEAGMEVTDPNANLPGTGTAGGLTVTSTGLNEAGVSSIVFTQNMVNISLNAVASNMYLSWKDVYVQNDLSVEPERMLLQYTTSGQRLAEIHLPQLLVHLKTTSTMKIQNRSGAEGAESDRLDNQPLTGKLYFINKHAPSVDTNTTGIVIPVNVVTGVIGQTAGAVNALKEPPYPKTIGAAKAVNVIVDPGQIKYSRISFYKLMNLATFLKATAPTTGANTNKIQIGKCQVFALEKMIGFGNAPLIAYETEFDLKSYVSYKQRPTIAQLNL